VSLGGGNLREVATALGDVLGYEYPREVDEAVTAYLHEVCGLPPSITSGIDLGNPT
jgi:hypothetical protein